MILIIFIVNTSEFVVFLLQLRGKSRREAATACAPLTAWLSLKSVVPNLFYAVAHLSLSAERRGPPSTEQ